MTQPTDFEGIDPIIREAMEGLPPDFDDFPLIFQKSIQPALSEKESIRREAATRAKRVTRIAWLVGIGGILLSLFAFRVPQLAILSGFGGLAIHGIGRAPLQKMGKDAKALIIEPIAEHLALNFIYAPASLPSIHDHKRVGLLPGWDRSKYEDLIIGNRNGVDFEFFEAHLEQRQTTTDSNGRTRTRWVTVFQGQCIRFDFHKRFFGQTLVKRDAGFFNFFGKMTMGELERAKLESSNFEKKFEVYTSDQVEARFLLTPDMMQRLVDLEDVFGGKDLRCAFDGGEMLIALEGANLFEPGSMFTPLDNPARTRELLNDFAAVFHLLDEVNRGRRTEEEDRGAPPYA